MATKKELLAQRGNIISSLKDKISEDESLLKLFKALNDVDDKLEKAKDLEDDDDIEEESEKKPAKKKEEKEPQEPEDKPEEDPDDEPEDEEELKKAAENEEAAVKEALQILSEGDLSDEQLENIADKYDLEVEDLEDIIYELISGDDEE